MEPRSYSASPIGLHFLLVGYNRLTGDVVDDATLPIRDVQADVGTFVVGVGRTFNLFGDLGLVTAAIPYSLATVTGSVFEQGAETKRSGLADARFKLSVNLVGNPAMSPGEFKTAPRRTIVGASINVIAPTGQYYDSKLINLGVNRWAFKPETGVSLPKGSWDFDAYAGVWFFTTNPDFFPGANVRAQDPMMTLQGHISYEFRPRLWVAINGTWYKGGSTLIDSRDRSTSLDNSRAGVTVSIPVSRYSVKVEYSSGVTARAGGDFKAATVAWQASWFSSHF
jgi:hypothetical protein